MAQFIPFDDKVEVLGTVVLNIIKSIDKIFELQMLDILKMYNITKVNKDDWYPLKNLLQSLKFINDEIGPNTLLAIGKGIPKHAVFPPDLHTLEDALNSIDVAYHMNHRGGEIGYYKLLEFDENGRNALMECYNPYPHHFDRGLIMCISRKFVSDGLSIVEVIADTSRPTRLDGADRDFFIIKW